MGDVNVKYGDQAAKTAGKLLKAARSLDLDVGVVQFSPDGHFQVPEEVADKAKVSYDALDDDGQPSETPQETPQEPQDDSDGTKGQENADSGSEAPKKNASRDTWVEYATSQGASEEETKSQDDGGLDRAALIAKYGPKE